MNDWQIALTVWAAIIGGVVVLAVVLVALMKWVGTKITERVTKYNGENIKDMPANVRAGFLRSLASTRREMNATIDSFEEMLGKDDT